MIELLSQSLFYVCLFAHCVNYAEWITLKTYNEIRDKHVYIAWKLHAPMTFLCLFFCTTETWWKYIMGAILVWLLFDAGTKHTTWKERPFFLLCIIFHHLGPCVALIYQTDKECVLNAFMFGLVWFCHSFNDLERYIFKPLGILKLFKGFHKGYKYAYAASLVLYAWYYVQRLPLGYNYTTAALGMQMLGRWFANGNWQNVTWMFYIEIPGLVSIVLINLLGGLYGSITSCVVCLLAYFLKQKFMPAIIWPEKVVLTDEVRSFLNNYPKGQKPDPESKKGWRTWFEQQTFSKGYPLVRACVYGDLQKLKELLDSGSEPQEPVKEWYDSTPIGWAASYGDVDCMVALILAGAQPFAINPIHGNVAIHHGYSQQADKL
eukprot:UN30457